MESKQAAQHDSTGLTLGSHWMRKHRDGPRGSDSPADHFSLWGEGWGEFSQQFHTLQITHSKKICNLNPTILSSFLHLQELICLMLYFILKFSFCHIYLFGKPTSCTVDENWKRKVTTSVKLYMSSQGRQRETVSTLWNFCVQ